MRLSASSSNFYFWFVFIFCVCAVFVLPCVLRLLLVIFREYYAAPSNGTLCAGTIGNHNRNDGLRSTPKAPETERTNKAARIARMWRLKSHINLTHTHTQGFCGATVHCVDPRASMLSPSSIFTLLSFSPFFRLFCCLCSSLSVAMWNFPETRYYWRPKLNRLNNKTAPSPVRKRVCLRCAGCNRTG